MDKNMEKMDRPTVYAITIGRVSSIKQGLQGDSLDQQDERNGSFLHTLSSQLNENIVVAKTFPLTESASGELGLQPLLKVLSYIETSKVPIKYAIIKSIDRGTRGGSEVYGFLKKEFAKRGVRLLDSYGVISTQSINTLGHLGVEYSWSKREPSYIAEILVAEQAKNEVGDILTRMIGAEIAYVREGYWVRNAPPGYQSYKTDTPHGKRYVLKEHPEESIWFIKMFELRATNSMTDHEIVNEINNLGYHSRFQSKRDPNDKTRIIGKRGGAKLTIKQMQRYISNPIYAGFNNEKWSMDKPVKCKFPGLVSIDIWNKANRGKITIVPNPEGVSIIKGKIEPWRLKKNKQNDLYPYKQYVKCDICLKPLLGSASTGKGGKPRPAYHCGRNHKSFRVKLQTFNETIESFCKNVKFTEEYKRKFKEAILREWYKREKSLSTDQSQLHKSIATCVTEIQGIKDSIKMSRSESVIRMLEEDIATLEGKKLEAEIILGRKDKEKLKIEVFINETEYYMEHLHELLLDKAKPHKSAAMFGLLFSTIPTYQDLVDGTPDLAPIFKLNDAYEESKEQFVTPWGFEPQCAG